MTKKMTCWKSSLKTTLWVNKVTGMCFSLLMSNTYKYTLSQDLSCVIKGSTRKIFGSNKEISQIMSYFGFPVQCMFSGSWNIDEKLTQELLNLETKSYSEDKTMAIDVKCAVGIIW